MADEDPLSAHRLDKAQSQRKAGAEKVKRSTRTAESLEKELDTTYEQYLATTDPKLRKVLRDGALDLARQLKEVALSEKVTPAQKSHYLEVAEKVERPEIKPLSRIAQARYDRTMRKERISKMAQSAETQLKFSQAREGKRSLVSPEDRERFERLLGNRPPQRPAPASAPAPAPKEQPKKPTTREQIVAVAQRRAVRRQLTKAQKPAPKQHIKLHPRKSALPKLSKGRNVKLQVPASDLPQTGRLRSVLNRGK